MHHLFPPLLSPPAYDTRSMRGSGFYLCLCALNYGEVNRHAFTNDQWAEMMFAMGVQCQYSCACIASLLARYYFMRAGDLGGMLTFINTDDGWDYLIKKEWVRDLQLSTKLYKGVAGKSLVLYSAPGLFLLQYFPSTP